jgi:hypothetical protein
MSEISAPQCPTHYSPVGNGDMLDIAVQENVPLSEVIEEYNFMGYNAV